MVIKPQPITSPPPKKTMAPPKFTPPTGSGGAGGAGGSGKVTASPAPTQTPSSGGMTYPEVENVWIQAGGNPQAAAMAAAVADASSGFNPAATRTNPDNTTSVGLWLIPKNGQPPGSIDPASNARAAIQLSNNGTDWQQWCVTWSDNNCGLDGGTYLGEGSNALGSLGQRLTPASYNVIGSAPAGSGTGASSATASSTTTGAQTTSKSHTVLLIIGLVAVLGIVVYAVRRANRGRTASPEDVATDVQTP